MSFSCIYNFFYLLFFIFFFFFFSSRRRHTRSLCDWSSDVCSSDLGATTANVSGSGMTYDIAVNGMTQTGTVIASQIGRASCRERVEISGVAGSVKKKKKMVRCNEDIGKKAI